MLAYGFTHNKNVHIDNIYTRTVTSNCTIQLKITEESYALTFSNKSHVGCGEPKEGYFILME